MNTRGFVLYGTLLSVPALGLADEDRIPEPATLTTVEGGGLRLVAREASWDQVFDRLASATGVEVEARGLPPVRVSVVCEGATPRALLSCLLGTEVGLVYRDASAAGQGESHGAAWVLGSATGLALTGSTGADPECAVKGKPEQAASTGSQSAPDLASTPSDLASAADPAVRAQGLGQLIAESPPGDGAALATLEAALGDADSEVRAQAVFGLAQLGGAESAASLDLALSDGDASVRLMAVDSILPQVHGSGLLRQALADPDETVRALAELKLGEMEAEESGSAGEASE